MKRKWIILALLPFLTGCFDSELVFEDQYRVVVESYLYAGSDRSTLSLTSMISFGNDSTGGDPISGALVILSGNSGQWEYAEIDTVPGTYELKEGPELNAGEPFELQIEAGEHMLSSATVIPETPPVVSMSATSISIPRAGDPEEFRELEWPDPIELSWENPDGESFFIKVQNIESNPVSIMPDPPDDMPFHDKEFVFQRFSRPTSDDHYEITTRDLTYYGTHRIIFYRVNEEYARLYESLEQDTHELNEPYSNVENGLGIFTAFNSDTLYFEVTQ